MRSVLLPLYAAPVVFLPLSMISDGYKGVADFFVRAGCIAWLANQVKMRNRSPFELRVAGSGRERAVRAVRANDDSPLRIMWMLSRVFWQLSRRRYCARGVEFLASRRCINRKL
ncbi:MAG: hypothetical protein FWD57_09670 [Polyangiaceae bacterium]|nr:hypothetical protein [Polyangiaceae bacterium]